MVFPLTSHAARSVSRLRQCLLVGTAPIDGEVSAKTELVPAERSGDGSTIVVRQALLLFPQFPISNPQFLFPLLPMVLPVTSGAVQRARRSRQCLLVGTPSTGNIVAAFVRTRSPRAAPPSHSASLGTRGPRSHPRAYGAGQSTGSLPPNICRACSISAGVVR
jgi:hypothetical protein